MHIICEEDRPPWCWCFTKRSHCNLCVHQSFNKKSISIFTNIWKMWNKSFY
jgi:hypothetical protein